MLFVNLLSITKHVIRHHGQEFCKDGETSAPRFLKVNEKSLIFTINAAQIYNLRLLCTQILIVPPNPNFNANSRLCATCIVIN